MQDMFKNSGGGLQLKAVVEVKSYRACKISKGKNGGVEGGRNKTPGGVHISLKMCCTSIQ